MCAVGRTKAVLVKCVSLADVKAACVRTERNTGSGFQLNTLLNNQHRKHHHHEKKEKKNMKNETVTFVFLQVFPINNILLLAMHTHFSGFTKVTGGDVLLHFCVTVTMMAEEGNYGNSEEGPGRRKKRWKKWTLDSYIFISVLTSVQC